MHKKIVDSAIYTAVGAHYVATAIYENTDDPLQGKRSGLLEGETDVVTVPDIPERTPQGEEKKPVLDFKPKPLSSSAWETIAEWVADNDPGAGDRHNYYNNVAAFLHNYGIGAEDVGEIIYEAATANNDEEAKSRLNCALRVCDAVERGMPMPGIPLLIERFAVEGVDKIVELLGSRKPDINAMIEKLTPNSEQNDLDAVFFAMKDLSSSMQEKFLQATKKKTGIGIMALRDDLQRVSMQASKKSERYDVGTDIANQMLRKHHGNGELLIRTDKVYRAYNSRWWEQVPDDYIGRQIFEVAQDMLKDMRDEERSTKLLVEEAVKITRWKSTEMGDALHLLREPAPIVNVLNAELHLNPDGSIDALPHHPDSKRMSCLNVEYNPKAKCPRFHKACLEIFAKASNPEDMMRHQYEEMGYMIQPKRDIAAFAMWIGNSNCGKSKLAETLTQICGDTAVLHMKLESFENDKDAIGNLAGKLLVIDDDLSQGVVLPDGIVKKMSETKRQTGELKYQNKFSFLSYAMLLLVGNQYPRIAKADYSIERRALITPFTRTFSKSEDNRDLFPSIWRDPEEMSGILNACLAGYQRLRKRGDFQLPQDCKYAYQEWVSGCNFVPVFLHEICQKNDGPNQPWPEHVKLFFEWGKEKGVRFNHFNASDLRKAYEMLGIEFGSTGGVLTVKGIIAPETPM